MGAEVDPNDPIMKAMMAEMAAPNTGTPPTVIAAVGTPPYRPPEVNQSLIAPSQQVPPANSALADVFGDDEDEQPQRQLVSYLFFKQQRIVTFMLGVSVIYPCSFLCRPLWYWPPSNESLPWCECRASFFSFLGFCLPETSKLFRR